MSRGLGDVYKRQTVDRAAVEVELTINSMSEASIAGS